MSEANDPCVERAKRLAQRVPQIDQEIAQHAATIKDLHKRVRALRREKRKTEAQATRALYDPQMELDDIRPAAPSLKDLLPPLSKAEQAVLGGRSRKARAAGPARAH